MPVRLLVVPADASAGVDREAILANAAKKLPPTMSVSVEVRSELERASSGKIPFVVRSDDLEWTHKRGELALGRFFQNGANSDGDLRANAVRVEHARIGSELSAELPPQARISPEPFEGGRQFIDAGNGNQASCFPRSRKNSGTAPTGVPITGNQMRPPRRTRQAGPRSDLAAP